MGAWGPGTFDNDDAADWIYELLEAGDLTPAREALAATMDSDGWLESPEGARAVAAAVVVAASFDGDVKGVPGEVVEWLGYHPDAATREDARLAADALERVLSEESELRELWVGAGEGREWTEQIQRVGRRLIRAAADEIG